MADTIKIGNLDISAFKVGSDDCKVYLGSTLLYSGGTPPTPSYKWIATYSDSHTESAECDSTSAITKNEINKTNLVSLEIGDCVTSIGNQCCMGFSKCTSISIGNGITSIGTYAFANCSKLSSITITATTPPGLGANVFYPYTFKGTFYVPSESVSTYQSTWSTYASQIQAIPNS